MFLAPGAAMSCFGALLAGELSIPAAIGHVIAVSLAVYVAHLKDGYVDYYVRGEDEGNPLSPGEIHAAIAISTGGFAVSVGALWVFAEPLAAALTVPVVVLGYLHAPHLDTNPVTATVDYPLGIVLATMGGYATQSGTVTPAVVAVCLVLFSLLAAINVLLDTLDYRHDRRISKRTVPVVLGPDRARIVAWGFVAVSIGLLGIACALGVLPRYAVFAGLCPAGAAIHCHVNGYAADRAVPLFIGTTYAFTGLLFLSVRAGPG